MTQGTPPDFTQEPTVIFGRANQLTLKNDPSNNAVVFNVDSTGLLTITTASGVVYTFTGIWTNFTPTLLQAAGVAATINYARYSIFGKTVTVQFQITATANGTAANPIIVGAIPAVIVPKQTGQYAVIGSGVYLRTGVIIYPTTVVAVTTTAWEFFGGNGTDRLGVNPSFAIAIGDILSGSVTYELA